MIPTPPADVLQLIASAVTPVVMVSAAALLISGISNKHQSMSDRVRSLAAEFRSSSTAEARKPSITRQMVWFDRRLRYSATAQRLLYLAILTFLVTILFIILAPTGLSWTAAVYVFFTAGVILMLTAVLFEFGELWWANRTIQVEIREVTGKVQ